MKLDPNNHFEAILIAMAEIHRSKGGDYASPEDRYSNFRETAEHIGSYPWITNEVMIQTKQSRIKQLLRKWLNDESPNNESLRDSLIDRAVYSVIGVILFDEEN